MIHFNLYLHLGTYYISFNINLSIIYICIFIDIIIIRNHYDYVRRNPIIYCIYP